VEVRIMTDFQFKAVIAMVLDKLDSVKTLEELDETKNTLRKLTKGVTDIQKEEQPPKE